MEEKRKRFKALYPDKYFLDQRDQVAMASYLYANGFIKPGEEITSATIPGAGNMNYVLRVITNERSFIVKQSRPWVEKYPSIDAPIDRINIEGAYYKSFENKQALTNASPKLHLIDSDNFIMILEDLGDVSDYTYLYKHGSDISDADIRSLANYLSALHNLEVIDFPSNMEMRKLNHEHIFNYPYKSDNGFNLEDVQIGLSALSINEKTDALLVALIQKTGQNYLGSGSSLLHGDFYPGSWMKSDKMYVLDPEFGFVGPPEFDLGVFIAHMNMANQRQESIDEFTAMYGGVNTFDNNLAHRFAGIEILRRILGVAQLPLPLTIPQKAKLINRAKSWIIV